MKIVQSVPDLCQNKPKSRNLKAYQIQNVSRETLPFSIYENDFHSTSLPFNFTFSQCLQIFEQSQLIADRDTIVGNDSKVACMTYGFYF
ncbi:hypothetical protein AF91_04300 [Lacticaseibacillus paracasei N1115]|uniref:Uncharacterized protein n=1 Tax=Lacticaseibacillus paracasei N1115 TaxID=1446494 RepID=A0A806LKT7_LACPA|nr:hypothetical protein AF91_04300 [Lacticaseibacillus paracasei N1115]